MKILNIYLFSILVFSSPTFAASLSVLTGNTYKTYSEQSYSKEIITIDHFGFWKYGSVFFYYDISNGVNKDDQSDFFGGISPMFSFTKISGYDFSNKYIHDIELKLEVEHVSNWTPVYYYGLSFPLKVSGFKYLVVAPVLRDDPTKNGVGGQLNLAWGRPFRIYKTEMLFTGFLSSGILPEFNDEFFLVTQPQILADMNPLFNTEKNQMYLGFEYSYAINRFLKKGTLNSAGGIEPGFNETVLQAMVRLYY
jgi:nucleoside-specific outer membrane channel protein Tsx